MPAPAITLLGKPGCHLCDEARSVVRGVVAEERAAGREVGLEERSILDDPALETRYREDIPVVLVDGVPLARWRVEPEELRRRLHAL